MDNQFSSLNEHLALYYQLKKDEAEAITKKFSQFFKTNILEDLFQDFLSLSKNVVLIPPNKQMLNSLGNLDAIKKAPKYHKIIFENETLRILEIIVKPGEIVPFHTHQWDSIAVTFQGSRFRILNSENHSEEKDWLVMAQKLKGSFDANSYTNIGSQKFHAIVFELKK